MRILKFILYTTLFLCIFWALLLTGGPRIISALIKQNFDNSLLVSGLKITPKLGISADRVEYVRLNTSSGQILDGFSRAIRLNWGGVFTAKPFVQISVGPTLLKDLGKVKSQEIVFSWRNLWDFKKFSFFYKADNLQYHEGVESAVATFDGKFDADKKTFRDLKFDFSKFKSGLRASISADRISGKIDSFDSSFNSNTFSLSSDINVFGLYLDDEQLFLPTSNFFIEVKPGNAKVILEAENVTSKLYRFEIGSVEIIADGSSVNLDSIESAKINVTAAFFSVGNQLLKNITVDSGSGTILFRKDGVINFDAKGIFRETLLETDSLFIAELPSTAFDISSEVGVSNTENYLNSSVLLDFESSPPSSAIVISDINFLKHSISECLKSLCSDIEHQIKYEVGVLDEKIKGFSDCSTLFCSDSSSTHRLETLNTEKFMRNIAQASIINPVLVTFLFSELLSGKKAKLGHIVEY